MRATIWREYGIEASHWLPLVPPGHKCGRTHGHSYRIRLCLHGEVGPLGWVVDFAEIDAVWAPLFKALDHEMLNTVPGLENPTSENLARWVWERVQPALPQLVEVVVQETERGGCSYRGEA